jgi:hypothetical protein
MDNQCEIRVKTKLPNSEQSYKGKVKTHKYINRQNQSKISSLSYKLLYIKDFQNKNVTCAWLNRIQ